MTRHQLDTRGLICPMPVIRVQDTISGLVTGDTLEVTCSDPGAAHDVPAWCRIHGHEVLQCDNNDDEIFIRIKVGPVAT